MSNGGFNKNHPELQPGEVWLTNIRTNRRNSNIIGWKTQRVGKAAFDKYGNPLDDLFPVFVRREELIKVGLNPDALPDILRKRGRL